MDPSVNEDLASTPKSGGESQVEVAAPFLSTRRLLLVLSLAALVALVVGAAVATRYSASATRRRAEDAARRAIAAAVESATRSASANDLDGALRHVSTRAVALRELVDANRHSTQISSLELQTLSIDSLNVDVEPPRATISLSAVAAGKARVWPLPTALPFYLKIELSDLAMERESDGEWRALDGYVAHVSAP